MPHRRLRFGNSVVARDCLLSGFSAQEDWGVWSDGEAALLALPLAPLDTASHILRLRLRVYLRAPAHPILNFRVACAGAEERLFATNQSEIEIDLPLPALWAPMLLLRFSIENPMAPVALGESSDPRRLGIGLIEAGLIPALPQLVGPR